MNSEQMQALRQELARDEYRGLTEEQGYALLHEPRTVTRQTTVPRTLTVAGVREFLSKESRKALVAYPHLMDIRDQIKNQDREGLREWAAFLLDGELITEQEAGAIITALAETETVETTEVLPARIADCFAGIAGMPNAIEPSDFHTAWEAVHVSA